MDITLGILAVISLMYARKQINDKIREMRAEQLITPKKVDVDVSAESLLIFLGGLELIRLLMYYLN